MTKTIGNRLHYGWIVVAITFVTLLVSAAIRALPGLFILPFEKEFGWDRGAISSVLSVGILLYGAVGPFSAAILLKYGIRRVVLISLGVLASALALTPLMTALWQYLLLWGVVAGLATGMMANVLGVTVANRWFSKRRGLVLGLLTASAATGQLVFLPILARITADTSWRTATYVAVGGAVVLFAAAALLMRNHPSDVGQAMYGEAEPTPPAPFRGGVFVEPLRALRGGFRSRTFWLLSGTFFFCGLSTNGLIGTHLIAACGDLGMPEVTAAGFLALMGLFDLIGTTLSGWLSDRYDSRKLLFWYYGLRGVSLLFLPHALQVGDAAMLAFTVFYGLDWIATVPPTAKLATQRFGREAAGMMFGWIVVAHQVGASVAAFGGGAMREWLGSYTVPFLLAGFLCFYAALMSLRVAKRASAEAAA